MYVWFSQGGGADFNHTFHNGGGGEMWQNTASDGRYLLYIHKFPLSDLVFQV